MGKDWGKIIWDTILIIQVRKGWCGWRGEKWSQYGYILKVEPSECANGLEIGCEKKSQSNTKIFDPKNFKMEMLFIDIGKIVESLNLLYFLTD